MTTAFLLVLEKHWLLFDVGAVTNLADFPPNADAIDNAADKKEDA